MIRLPASLEAWSTPQFQQTLKHEIKRLDTTLLPLQQCLSQSSYALPDDIEVILIHAVEKTDSLEVKVDLFFKGMIPGCACADDPTPESTYTEHCLMEFSIDKKTAIATITLEPISKLSTAR